MSTAIQYDVQVHDRLRDAFMEQIVNAVNGYFKVYTIYLGSRLGLYTALAHGQALTSRELAVRTATDERYVREWLEQQAVTGILEVEDETASALERRYRLPSGHAEVLLDRESVNYLAPLARAAVGVARPLEELETVFRTGGGIPLDAYGEDMRRGVGELNRPLFLHQLGREYFPTIPDIHRRLSADPLARVADMGCGTGWSSIGMARSYPKIRVDGFDLGEASIADARFNIMGCLPAGMAEKPSAATGTVMRPHTLRQYARQAGFGDVEILSIL